MLNRRQTLAGLCGAAICQIPEALFAQSLAVGQRKVTSLSDGNLVLPGDMFFDHLPKEPLHEILAQTGVARDRLEPPCNLTLLQDGDRVVLFDAGSGPGFMPSAGRIVDSLDALGIAPDDVTHVVFRWGRMEKRV